MQVSRNLISDSPLVQETIDLLRECGGSASASDIADIVLRISNLKADLAVLIVAELIRDDFRLCVRDGGTVELICDDTESRLLKEVDFVVVDLETTGAKAPPCRVTEIGAYRISKGKIVEEFQTLVNPEIPIPPFIVNLTGINNQMVKDAPCFADVAPRWLDFAGDAVLVAHNASFDVRFLNHELSRVFPGRRMANSNLCTVVLSRRIFPGLDNYRLQTVAEHFSITINNRHRAASDALATAEIFVRMLERMDEHGVQDLAAARRFKITS